MSSLTVNDFFSLSQYAHRNLWLEGEYVWMALSRMEKYFQTISFAAKKEKIPPSVTIDKPDQVLLGENVILEPEVYIQGPCILGRGCIIRHGAYLRGGVICGNNCVIGHASEIKHSIFLNGAQVGHLVYVGDSILGGRVNLGAGVKCANLRLDRQEIMVSFDNAKIPTGLKKMGAIIGDGCQIGCNTVINPGTLVGSESVSYPLVNIHGAIPPRSLIKPKNFEIEISPNEIARLDWLRR